MLQNKNQVTDKTHQHASSFPQTRGPKKTRQSSVIVFTTRAEERAALTGRGDRGQFYQRTQCTTLELGFHVLPQQNNHLSI